MIAANQGCHVCQKCLELGKSLEMSGKSGKSLELAYLSGKSLEFEENSPDDSLVKLFRT